jgi:hypothetical protein
MQLSLVPLSRVVDNRTSQPEPRPSGLAEKQRLKLGLSHTVQVLWPSYAKKPISQLGQGGLCSVHGRAFSVVHVHAVICAVPCVQ